MLRKIAITLALTAALPVFADDVQLMDEARKVAVSIPPKLLEVLDEEIRKGGPENAIAVCREKAPAMAKAASEKTGWAIRRVSLKNRNPKGVPDAWEAQAIAELDKRLAAGEKPETLDMHAVVGNGDGKEFRYAKALVTQPLCLNCHGDPEKMPPDVKAALAAEYPNDKAVGYSAGMIRGILSIRKPL